MELIEGRYRYFAFISYKREDEQWARWLQQKLEHYKLPSNLNGRTDLPREIRPVFKDTSELTPGNLPEQIHEALNLSKYLVVICSPRSAQSEWVNKEVVTFIEMERTERIIPFIIEGSAFAKHPADECFPLALRQLPEDREILGANVNEMGRDAAAVKVVARMFDVRFDELWQRYEREQRRRRMFIIGGALLLALSGVAVAVGFSLQNKRIQEQNEWISRQNEDILNKNERLQNDSVVMAAQLDSINKRDVLILQQQDSIEFTNANLEKTNAQLIVERNNLKSANWKMMENRARYIAKEASDLIDNGDEYTAERMLLDVLPNDLNNPNKPYTIEAEIAMRKACCGSSVQPSKAILKIEGLSSGRFSPDGKNIITESDLGSVDVWDTGSGKKVRSYSGYTSDISPDGKYIIVGSEDDVLNVWDTASGKLVMKLDESDPVESVSFSPNGMFVVSILDGRSGIALWNVKTGKKLWSHEDPVYLATFSPDSKWVVVSKDMSPNPNMEYLEIWDVESGREIHSLNGHTGHVCSTSFSPDGRRIVSASYDKTVRIWDCLTGQCIKTLNKHSEPVFSASFSPDGKRVVSASDDNTIRIWDAETGELLKTMAEHSSFVRFAAFNSNGKQIISHSYDNTVRIWNAESGQLIRTLEGHTRPVIDAAFSPDEKHILSVSTDETLRLWDTEVRQYGRTLTGHSDAVTSAAFSPDGKRVVSASKDSTLRIWDFSSGQVLRTMREHTGTVSSVAFSPDGTQIVSVADGSINVWDVNSCRLIRAFVDDDNPAKYATFSPDGKRIAATYSENVVKVWDLMSGQECWSYDDFYASVNYAAFSPDGKRLATVSSDVNLTILDIKTGQEMLSVDLGSSYSPDFLTVNSVAYSPDGNYILSAADDGSVQFRDSYTGLLYQNFKHKEKVSSAFFSPNGKLIVTASDDGIVRIWDTISGQEVFSFGGDCKPVQSASFSPNGRHIVSVSDDNNLRIWDYLPLQGLIDQTRERFKNRPLTPEERRQYYLE